MKRGVLGWLVGIFLLAAMVLLVGFNLTKPRILVLHGGQRSIGWNQRIDEGVLRTVDAVRSEWWYAALARRGATAAVARIGESKVCWYGRDPAWKDVKGFRGKADVEKPVGEWNTIECLCDGGKIIKGLLG